MTRLRPLTVASAALATVAAGTGAVFAVSAATHLMATSRTHQPTSVPNRPVALVLGAQVFARGKPSAFLIGRLDIAVGLYERGTVHAVVVSGDDAAEHHHETSTMRDYLIDHGVPADAIISDDHGSDTYDSLIRAKMAGLQSLIIVSQTYHLPRSLCTARLLGMDALGVGDASVRRYPGAWRRGVRREVLANLKMIVDVASRRPPAVAGNVPSPSPALRSGWPGSS